MSTTEYPEVSAQRADRRRAAQIRQRKFERRLLQIVTIAAAVLLVILIIVLIVSGTRGKKISTLNTEITKLQTEKTELQTQVTDLQAALEEEKTKSNLRGAVDSGFFSDALIVGDSITIDLQKYVEDQRDSGEDCLGEAQFYTAGSLSWGSLLLDLGSSEAVFPSFNNETMRLEDAVVSSGATKVYIMLGMNDIAADGVTTTMSNVEKQVSAIREKAPDVQIIIQSTTPITAERQTETLSNTTIAEFDAALKTWCGENNVFYLDLIPMLSGEDGALNPDYCRDPEDMGIQFNDTCCEAWVAYLLAHPYGL